MNSVGLNRPTILAIAVFTALAPLRARAGNIIYAVDPTRSTLTISGTLAGQAIQAQAAGSLTTCYSGTVVADRDSVANSFQISGGTVTASDSGIYEPFNLPSNYGVVGLGVFLQSAIRNFSFAPTSPAITSPAAFDAAEITAVITSGEIDYIVLGGTTLPGGTDSGYDDFEALSGNLAFDAGMASLTDGGGVETLNIPVGTTFSVPIESAPFGESLTLDISGTIVATGDIPGPSSLLILGLSGAWALATNRRQHK